MIRLEKATCQLLAVSLLTLAALAQPNPGTQPPRTEDQQVTLTVTVTDRQHRIVKDLGAADFKVYEDGKPQPIVGVSQGYVPVCMGLVVDNSGSMRPKRAAVTTALLDLINGRDEKDLFFVVNFNDKAYLDQDLTSDSEKIRAGLDRVDAHGGTALYDAIIASADHLQKSRNCGKRILVVVSDGEDNSSRSNLQKTLETLINVDSPIVYALTFPETHGLFERANAAERALQAITNATGGATFLGSSGKDMKRVDARLLEELAGQYTITYIRSGGTGDGRRNIQVTATVSGQSLPARTRIAIKNQPGR